MICSRHPGVNGAHLNGEPIHVSERAGSRMTVSLLPGFRSERGGALDIYLNIFRRVFLEAQGHTPVRLRSAGSGLHRGRRVRWLSSSFVSQPGTSRLATS